MRAIRFHGRGGQGAKTASRILGTAAFLEGCIAQDAPLYGAERRGAPVLASTRIGHEPIRERGAITRPDLIVVADESLIGDPAARVLDGMSERTAVFVNTTRSPIEAKQHFHIPGRVTTLDLTGLALKVFGKTGALSAALGAVACRLLELKTESLRAAVADELAGLGLPGPVLERNQALAASCYDAVPVVPVEETSGAPAPVALRTPVYDPPTRGTARITAGPNSAIRSMSGWRTFRPVLRPELCNGCWLCFANCPEGAITIKPDGRPAVYYPHCKGCLDCVEVCPTDAMTVERETEATQA